MKAKYSITIILSAFITLKTAAQTKPAQARPDTSGKQLATQLGISKARAKKVAMAFNYKADEIQKLMRDTTMKPALRRQKLKELLDERRRLIGNVVTPGLRDTLNRKLGDREASAQQKRQAQLVRFEARLNSNGHKVHRVTNASDSTRVNKISKPKTRITQ